MNLLTIWKFPLFTTEDGKESIPATLAIEMPKGAEILSVEVMGGRPYVWALVDPHAETNNRYFHAAVTGKLIDFNPKVKVFIGTVILKNQAEYDYVVHFFASTNQ